MARLIRITSWGQAMTVPDLSGRAGAMAAPPVVELAERQVEEWPLTLAVEERPVTLALSSGERELALRRADAQARAEERRRISRLLHDEIGQSLTALTVRLAVLHRHSCGAMRKELREAQKLLEKALSDVQGLSKELHPSAVEDLGLFAALRSRIQRFSEESATTARLEADEGSLAGIEVGLALAVFRSVEMLLSDLREARAGKVILRLRMEPGALQLEARAQMGRTKVKPGRPPDLAPEARNFQEQVLIAGGAAQCRARGHEAIITAQFPMMNGKI